MIGEADVVVLEVVDTGKGIRAEVEKRLSTRFSPPRPGGTGPGLFDRLAVGRDNGGALQYQTRINRGSTFGIVLPRVDV